MPARMTGLGGFAVWLWLSLALLGCGASRHARVKTGPMPDGGTFTGVWFSPQYGEMHLIHNGATVVGRYNKDERRGRIQGGVEGNVMRFDWNERRELITGHPSISKGRGYFRLLRDEQEDNWKLIGEWGTDTYETGGGPWNAVKSKTRRPELSDDDSPSGQASPTSDESGDEGEPEATDDLGDL